jgi:hypothetical protein
MVCFGEEIVGTKVINPKTALGSSPNEDVWSMDNNFSYDIQRCVNRMIRFMISFQAIKTDEKCKHL